MGPDCTSIPEVVTVLSARDLIAHRDIMVNPWYDCPRVSYYEMARSESQ